MRKRSDALKVREAAFGGTGRTSLQVRCIGDFRKIIPILVRPTDGAMRDHCLTGRYQYCCANLLNNVDNAFGAVSAAHAARATAFRKKH